jgi:hypothetical protein
MLDCSSGTRFPLKVMVLELKFGLMVTVALFPPSVSGTEPCLSIPQHRSGVVPGCRDIEILPHTLLKAPELYQLVAHHIRIGSQATSYFINGISRHLVPILPVQVHYFQR